MNPIIVILLCFAALGLFDKMFKNRLGLATSFDRGIITMGDFMMSVGARSWWIFHYRVDDTF